MTAFSQSQLCHSYVIVTALSQFCDNHGPLSQFQYMECVLFTQLFQTFIQRSAKFGLSLLVSFTYNYFIPSGAIIISADSSTGCRSTRSVRMVTGYMSEAMSKRVPCTILFASETGTSEQYAYNLQKLFNLAFNCSVSIHDTSPDLPYLTCCDTLCNQ